MKCCFSFSRHLTSQQLFFPLERRDFIFVSLFLIFSKKVKMQKSEKREKNRFRIFLTKFLTGLVTTRVFNSTGAKGKNKTRFRIVGGAQLLSLSLSHAHTHYLSLARLLSLSFSLSKRRTSTIFFRSLSLSFSRSIHTRSLYVRAWGCMRVCVCVFRLTRSLMHTLTPISDQFS